MKRPVNKYADAGNRTFEIVKESGKAPYKVLFMEDGVERRRTHHKTEALALGKCRTYNPNVPVYNFCFEPTGETLDEVVARDLGR
jgi:hypothetical protein